MRGSPAPAPQNQAEQSSQLWRAAGAKSQIRNPKSETSSKDPNPNVPNRAPRGATALVSREPPPMKPNAGATRRHGFFSPTWWLAGAEREHAGLRGGSLRNVKHWLEAPGFRTLGHWNFDFVSALELRISDLRRHTLPCRLLWVTCMRSRPDQVETFVPRSAFCAPGSQSAGFLIVSPRRPGVSFAP